MQMYMGAGQVRAGRDVISDDLRRFIGLCFPTVTHLEAALYLRGRSALDVSCDEIAAALYLSPEQTAGRLRSLCEAGILAGSSERGFRWAPSDPTVAALLEDSAEAYATDLRGVTALIHGAQGR